MCDGIIVDGHLIPQLRLEMISEKGLLYEIISWALLNCGISTSEYIEDHWKTHCAERYREFWSWYDEQVLNRTIRVIPNEHLNKINGTTFKKISQNHKLPKDCFIKAYLDCVNSTSDPRYILADDMYFYDPPAKRLQSEKQIKIREDRTGMLCRYFEKNLKIRVGTPSYCKNVFVAKGTCLNKPSSVQKPCIHLP